MLVSSTENQIKKKYIPFYEQIFGSFFDEYSFVSHQLQSYEDFIDITLHRTVEGKKVFLSPSKKNGVNISFEPSDYIIFKHLSFEHPSPEFKNSSINIYTPNEARLTGCMYSIPIYVTIEDSKENERSAMLRKTRRYLLAHIPLMVRSKYCTLYGLNSLQLQHLGECPNDMEDIS